tara:strand:+ start:2737 stop:3276 length:540 start_codon:yes stop_codon:yes gene_type:complete
MDLETFLHSLDDINWFNNLGSKLTPNISVIANQYLDVTGNGGAPIKIPKNWEEAKVVMKSAQNADFNGFTELTVRRTLREQAIVVQTPRNCDGLLNLSLDQISKIANKVSISVPAGLSSGSETDFLPKAAAGALAEAAYDNVLWLLAEGASDHPIQLKFQLFSEGRWPIGLGKKNFYLW